MHSDGGRAAVFAALDTGRRADAVVRRLADGIALGILAPDEQLPSETELADTFGVSPVTVREALTILREQGLVATRRGRGGGSFVRDVRDVLGDGRGAASALHERLRAVSPSELRDLADWLGLDVVTVEPRGDLAPALLALVGGAAADRSKTPGR